MDAVIVEKVGKRYGTVEAVKGVSLNVGTGELFGLIGPDGAGKTTLMRAMCTLLEPDDGRIMIKGIDVMLNMRDVRARIGYMPQRFSLYQDLSVEQNLHFFADLFGVPAAERDRYKEELYRFSRMEPFKKRRASALSGGMKQKLALSCALIHRPEILILDEPTFGVDPVSRAEFWDLLRSIRAGGTTIVVSTAYMEEADMCDRVALLFGGRIIASGTPRELKAAYPYPLYRITGRDVHALRDFFAGGGRSAGSGAAGDAPAAPVTMGSAVAPGAGGAKVRGIQLFGDCLHVSFSGEPGAGLWEAWRGKSGDEHLMWERQEPGIEDVFLELIQDGRNANG